MTADGRIALGSSFSAHLAQVLPRLLGQPGALPDDWDHRATTYDLFRFDSDDQFAERFERAIAGIVAEDVTSVAAIRERLAACGLPFDYARLGQPLSTVFELAEQARTNAARCFSFASVTKPWLAVIEAPRRTLPVRVFAEGALPLSAQKRAALVAAGVALHEHARELPPADPAVLTVWVASGRFVGDVQASAADAICYPVHQGGVLLLRDTARIAPGPIRSSASARSPRCSPPTRSTSWRAPPTSRRRRSRPPTRRLPGAPDQPVPADHRQPVLLHRLAAEAALFTGAAEVLGPAR
jgi:hypothetical protein